MKRKFLNRFGLFVIYFIFGLVFTLSYAIICICDWSKKTFNVGIDEIYFTITSPLKGADTNFLESAIKYCVPRILIVLIGWIIICLIDYSIKNKLNLFFKVKKTNIKFNLRIVFRSLGCVLSFMFLCYSFYYVDLKYELFEYIKARQQYSKIYEQNYVDPKTQNIRLLSSNNKKNLICIYLESLETTYASKDVGGFQNINYIQNLTNIAQNNISFSNSSQLGGFHNTYGTKNTMCSLFATTAGIPFDFPVEENTMNNRTSFASGLTNLGDVLNDFYYKQLFLCGSVADFAGRKTYFSQHGNYEIYDLFNAREDGYTPSDYYVNWGYEDKILYQIAKDKLIELSSGEDPFNLTMLTADTHFPGGYVCEDCPIGEMSDAEKSIICADNQILSFISWCKEQDFYEDTIIVIMGDHQRMDTCLVDGIAGFDRTMYNCFINCDNLIDINSQNRVFTPMDMFPTILASMSFCWDSNRLGLGTNLFSKEKTLAEELGFENFNAEITKKSNYYKKFY